MKPLLHIYVLPQQHSLSASSSLFLIYHSPSTPMFQMQSRCQYSCMSCFRVGKGGRGGGHTVITSSEGRLHTVASLTSCCRPLHREGELLRESNSAVREESCLHCCRRRCGRGARLQKGRREGGHLQAELNKKKCSGFHYANRTLNLPTRSFKTKESLPPEKWSFL